MFDEGSANLLADIVLDGDFSLAEKMVQYGIARRWNCSGSRPVWCARV